MIESSASSGLGPKVKPEATVAGVTSEGTTTGGDGGEDEAPAAGPSRGGKNSGLRKVRLGAFEDTGRCKG